MTIAVIQNRPLIQYGNELYSFNPVDIEKYIRLSDRLVYLASSMKSNNKDVTGYRKVDYPQVSVGIVDKRPFLDLLSLSKRTKKVVLKAIEESDIIVIKVPSMTLGRWAYRQAQKQGKVCIVEVIGCAWDSYWYHSLKGKILAPINLWITKRMVAGADHVLYVTQRFLQHRYPNSHHHVGCSNVVLLPKSETVLSERLKKIETMPSGRLKIGTAGAVNIPYKGQEYVIRAIALLKNKGISCEYFLAGGGDNSRLKEIARKANVAENIHFLGAVPKQEMGDYYRSLDLYIHPSLAEGLPRVLIEAESYALPALGANAAGTPELLDESCVFGKKDVNGIVEAIAGMTKEKMKEQARGNFCRAKEYMPEVLENRRKKFYNEILKDEKDTI